MVARNTGERFRISSLRRYLKIRARLSSDTLLPKNIVGETCHGLPSRRITVKQVNRHLKGAITFNELGENGT